MLQVAPGFCIVKPEQVADKTDNIRARFAAVGGLAFVPTSFHVDAKRRVVVIVEGAACPGETVFAMYEVRQQVLKDNGWIDSGVYPTQMDLTAFCGKSV